MDGPAVYTDDNRYIGSPAFPESETIQSNYNYEEVFVRPKFLGNTNVLMLTPRGFLMMTNRRRAIRTGICK